MHQIQTHQSAYFAKEMPFKSLPHDHMITFFLHLISMIGFVLKHTRAKRNEQIFNKYMLYIKKKVFILCNVAKVRPKVIS